MPVLVEPATDALAVLLRALPTGAHGVATVERALTWLDKHSDEYVVVLGPGVDPHEALALCDALRTTHPAVSVVLIRDNPTAETLASAMRAGARDVIASGSLEAISAAVERAAQLSAALRGAGPGKNPGRVVTVWSPKGGVGKTTVSVNLALALAAGDARSVCLVDLDLAFGDVAITMQLFPAHSIEHAIGSEGSIDADLLGGLLTRHHDSLTILAAPAHPDVRERISPALVAQIIRTLTRSFDVVVIDTAPALDEHALTALEETDELVIVATLDVPTLKNVKVSLETLDVLGIAADHRHLLLNRADDAVGLHPDRVENILGLQPAVHVTTSIEVAAATNAGTPIVVKNPYHPASAAFLDLAARVAGERTDHEPIDSDGVETPTPRRFGRHLLRRR